MTRYPGAKTVTPDNDPGCVSSAEIHDPLVDLLGVLHDPSLIRHGGCTICVASVVTTDDVAVKLTEHLEK